MGNYLIPILVVLIGAFITIRYSEIKRKREKFDKEYSEFKNSFFPFINTLENIEINLNVALLSDFPIHNDAKRKFVHNLAGTRLDRFNEKWAEYEEEYYKVKDLGLFGIAAAIAPDEVALSNATPLDAQQWEFDRKKHIHKIIHELFEISKIKIWF